VLHNSPLYQGSRLAALILLRQVLNWRLNFAIPFFQFENASDARSSELRLPLGSIHARNRDKVASYVTFLIWVPRLPIRLQFATMQPYSATPHHVPSLARSHCIDFYDHASRAVASGLCRPWGKAEADYLSGGTLEAASWWMDLMPSHQAI
jgi:hypothetical protein